ncbi:hypothetical protein [Pseudogulbenkiania sp. MAI-1]|uniref:hypothetical protein n=1 Tax=Pseudogulbenkiania sp. MAI-1 TaxID=990370 RepID=UPI00045E82ED|nr:hypothetical protein [Pseudogulbenkiania sp. MAI-1]
MPRIRFDYPGEDGHLAVSLATFQAYCAEHELDPQAALHQAICQYFAGLCDDNGKLFPIADNRIRHAAMPSGLRGLKALAAAYGFEIRSYPPVPRHDSIEVAFPECPEEGRVTLSAFLRRCRFLAETPEEVIQHAVWLLVTRHPDLHE